MNTETAAGAVEQEAILPPLGTRLVLPHLGGLVVKMARPVAGEIRLRSIRGRIWDMKASEFNRHFADGSIQLDDRKD